MQPTVLKKQQLYYLIKGYEGAPVIENGHVVGILTLSDIITGNCQR